jgi:hypothetical protein
VSALLAAGGVDRGVAGPGREVRPVGKRVTSPTSSARMPAVPALRCRRCPSDASPRASTCWRSRLVGSLGLRPVLSSSPTRSRRAGGGCVRATHAATRSRAGRGPYNGGRTSRHGRPAPRKSAGGIGQPQRGRVTVSCGFGDVRLVRHGWGTPADLPCPVSGRVTAAGAWSRADTMRGGSDVGDEVRALP